MRNGVTTLNSFTISDGFLSGANTLRFMVNNETLPDAINPTGLLISNISGQASLSPALWLFGSGLLGLIGVAKRKKA